MKKVILVAAVAILGASPALAQYAPPPPYNPGAFWRGAPQSPYQRIQFLQDRVNRGIGDGSLDRAEGARVNRQLQGVRQWIRDMHWEDEGRLTPDQRARVQGRLDRISGEIRWMRHNGW